MASRRTQAQGSQLEHETQPPAPHPRWPAVPTCCHLVPLQGDGSLSKAWPPLSLVSLCCGDIWGQSGKPSPPLPSFPAPAGLWISETSRGVEHIWPAGERHGKHLGEEGGRPAGRAAGGEGGRERGAEGSCRSQDPRDRILAPLQTARRAPWCRVSECVDEGGGCAHTCDYRYASG